MSFFLACLVGLCTCVRVSRAIVVLFGERGLWGGTVVVKPFLHFKVVLLERQNKDLITFLNCKNMLSNLSFKLMSCCCFY